MEIAEIVQTGDDFYTPAWLHGNWDLRGIK